MGCTKCIVKNTLYLLNLIFTLVGLAIVGFASYGLYYYIHKDLKQQIHNAGFQGIVLGIADNLDLLLLAVIAFGSVIFLISFCGCCGSISEKKCLLSMYAVFMFVLFGASLFFIYIIKGTEQLDKIKSNVESIGNKIFDPKVNRISEEVEIIQYFYECCGTNGHEFYSKLGSIPPSCCPTADLRTRQINHKCTKDNVHQTGCITKFMEHIELMENYILYTVIAAAATEFVSMLFALYLIIYISNKKQRDERPRSYVGLKQSGY